MSIKKLLFVLYGVPFLFLFFFWCCYCCFCQYVVVAAVIVALLSFSFFPPLSIILALVRGPVSLHSLRSLSLTSQPAVAKKKKKKRYRTCRCCCFCCFLTRCAALLDSPFFSSSCLFASQTACFPCVRVTIRKRHTTACVAANAHTANF